MPLLISLIWRSVGEASRSSTIRAMLPSDPDDPAVTVRAFDRGRDHSRCGPGATVRSPEAVSVADVRSGTSPDSRITVPDLPGEQGFGLLQRMGCSELRLLKGEPEILVCA